MNMNSKVKLKKMAVTVLHFYFFLLEIPFLWPKWPEKRPKLPFCVSSVNFASHYFENRSIFCYIFHKFYTTSKLMQSGQNCKKLKIGSFFHFFFTLGPKKS